MRARCSRRLAAVLLLLAASLQHPHPAAADGAALDEATIMRRLRQRANEAGLVKSESHDWTGWQPSDPTHHCYWRHVTCSSGRVTQIDWPDRLLSNTLPPPARAALLLPELAQLSSLINLSVQHDVLELRLPLEWGMPGAFPSLQNLVLAFPFFSAPDPLPPLEPGALPRLKRLNILLEWQERPVPLPPSWGSADVWPELRELVLVMPVQLPLPATWAQGYPRLTELYVVGAAWNAGRADQPAAAPARLQAAHPLPTEWVRGFPQLKKLVLAGLGLNGTFPAAWQANGSFPQLRKLHLELNHLSGPLPTHLLCNLPLLEDLKLGYNELTGRLPDEWAACKNGIREIHLGGNQLTGPAFPPAWVAPNGALDLELLSLAHNPGLVGALPAALNWSRLVVLYLEGTGVRGGVPAQWCQASFAPRIRVIRTEDVPFSLPSTGLPPCAKHAMPAFADWAREMHEALTVPSGGHSATNGTGAAGLLHSGSARRLLLLLVLALVALAIAAAAAAVYQQRRSRAAARGFVRPRRQQRSGSVDDTDELELLRLEPFALDGTGMRHRRPPLPHDLVPGRARLKALAQRQLGGTALLSGRPEAQLLSLLRGAEHMHSKPSNQTGLLDGGGSACLLRLPHEVHSSSGGDGGGSSAARVPLVQGWGLPTDSLRVAAADLQFIAEPDGSLVQLGEGAHGVVYLAKLTDMYVAVKVFAVQPGMDSQAFWQEVALLKRCVHPRIVPIYGVAVHGELLMVAMQLMIGGSLRTALINPEWQAQLRWNNRGRHVALDVAEAVAYLHGEALILHSDIKSANVLLDQHWRAALTDLGVAQVMENTARTAAGGSNLYAAPEQLLGQRCTLAADIYSLGLLLAELTTRHVIVKRGTWELPQVPDDCPQDVADLIDQCLSSDPSQRPTAAEVLRRLRASGSGNEESATAAERGE